MSLHTNTSSLTYGESLVISAVVTDPDGIDDLIGGNLTTIDGSSAYGAFATDASEGAYALTLSWATIDATSPIATDPGQTAMREFRAVFYDAEGNTAYQDTGVGLGCSNATEGACDGTCATFDTESHCGACDHACPLPDGNKCQMDSATTYGCYVEQYSSTPAACSTLCVAPYGIYVVAAAHYAGGASSVQIACGTVPPATSATGDLLELQCECTDR